MRAIVENIDKSGFTRDEPWRLSGSSLPEHETYFFYLQRICNHCTYPGCLAACPRKAIYKRPEDGIVLIDQNRCRGYKKCVEQCPFKKPMYRGTTRVSEKCIACYPRIEGLAVIVIMRDDEVWTDTCRLSLTLRIRICHRGSRRAFATPIKAEDLSSGDLSSLIQSLTLA